MAAYTYPITSPSSSATRTTTVLVLDLRAEEPGVAALGIGAGREEPLGVEVVMHAHQQRAETPEHGQVRSGGGADQDGHDNGQDTRNHSALSACVGATWMARRTGAALASSAVSVSASSTAA